MSPDKLIYMANQIGKYFASQKHTDPAENIADHLAKFWDPGMRAKIVRHVEQGGGGLDPDVKEAVLLLAGKDDSASTAPPTRSIKAS
jgi:formate dehydrogenase subunit delta